MKQRPVIVLTGGPGGGKFTLLADLRRDPQWARSFVALPETVHAVRSVNISPQDKLFQRIMVTFQMALEDELDSALGPQDLRCIICHRGSLDPLAFWLQRGWPEQEFCAFTGTCREDHYRRYAAVVHLVTCADGALWAYTRRPEAHRPEAPDEAIRLDRWLQGIWSGHPHYFRLNNIGRNWPTKSQEARHILSRVALP
jgi:hypothetical protein